MYAEAGLQLPAFSQCFLQEVDGGGFQGHDDDSPLPLSGVESFLNFHVGIADGGLDLGIMAQAPTGAEYDMGGEGDLFNALEAILEEPALELDIAFAMPFISTEGDAITEPIKFVDIELIHNGHLNRVVYECKKDLLEESEIEDSITELLGAKIPEIQIDEEVPTFERLSSAEGSMQKSISSGSVNPVELIPGSTIRPDQFLDLQGSDLTTAYSLRRACSEGDIQRLGDKSPSTGNTVAACSPFERLPTISDLKTEQRQQKLSRYREKKSKRNFGRKIKYACRKALADSQPRVRGRFAKTEECETRHANANTASG